MSIFNEHTAEKIQEALDRHFNKLDELIATVQASQPRESYFRLKNTVLLDGSGNGAAYLPVPPGQDWTVERVTVTSTGNGEARLFVDTTNLSDLVEEIGSSQVYSDAVSNNVYVPSQSTLIVQFTGAGAGGSATYNLQIKRVQR